MNKLKTNNLQFAYRVQNYAHIYILTFMSVNITVHI